MNFPVFDILARRADLDPDRIAMEDPGDAGYRSLRDNCEPLEGRTVWPSDETWYLLYTSGTTGMPKAVIQTYSMAMANYINTAQMKVLTGWIRTLATDL